MAAKKCGTCAQRRAARQSARQSVKRQEPHKQFWTNLLIEIRRAELAAVNQEPEAIPYEMRDMLLNLAKSSGIKVT